MLRGARQVGKTSAIRNLGKRFKHFVEINFEVFPLYAIGKAITNEACQLVPHHNQISI